MDIYAINPTATREHPSRPTLASRLRGDRGYLLIVTLLGAVLRFICLSRPTLWNDEVMTYSRICGTHRQMLDILREDTFGPLYYEMHWWMARVLPMTPANLRLVPAIAGTLMIPAVYLLGWELFGRRVARLSSVFAAGSAFLLAYSRDAKMYMELWLAVTAHVAFMYTALRTGRASPWVGWFISGLVAVWLHVTGFIIGPLDLLIVLIHPRVNLTRTMMILLSLAAIFGGPAWFVARVSRVPELVKRQGWEATGISWVSVRTASHTTDALLADTAGAFAAAYSWIEEPTGRAKLTAWPMLAAATFLSILSMVLGAGILPWRSLVPRAVERGKDAVDAADPGDGARWRAMFLITFWIVVPVYAVFRISAIDRVTLMERGAALLRLPAHLWMVCSVAFATLVYAAAIPRIKKILVFLTLLQVGTFTTLSIFRAFLLDINSPVRAARWLGSNLPLGTLGMAALICLTALAWNGCGPTFRRRLHRAGRGFILLATCVALCVGIDSLTNRGQRGSVWMPRYLGFIYPALLVGTAALLLRLPWAPVRWFAVGLFLALNLSQAGAHLVCGSEPPLDKVAADVVMGSKSRAKYLVYTPDTSHTFGPNAVGSITNACGLYYLLLESGRHLTPEQLRYHGAWEFFPLRLTDSPASIKIDLAVHSAVEHLILWTRDDEADLPGIDTAIRNSNPGWRKQSEQLYPVRSFWNWGFHYVYRRVEYVRER